MKIIYLYPKGSFRNDLRSDTLWGTICWAIRNVFGLKDLENFLNSYNANEPEFIISSAFPFIKNGEIKIPFLPKPNLPVEKYITDNDKNINQFKRIKDIKKISFFEKSDFEKLIKSEISLRTLQNDILDKTKNKVPKILSETTTHNTIDRIKGGTLKLASGQLFHIDEKYLDPENSGLFFLAKGENLEKLESALRFLSHTGIGGDRNTGKGFFDYEIFDFNIDEPKEYNAVTNLSLYYPKKEELDIYKQNPKFFNYQLEDRQGKIGFLKYQKFDKYNTTMFKEGSVFPISQPNTITNYGQNRDVRPTENKEDITHPVFQYGFGFMIKLKIQEL